MLSNHAFKAFDLGFLSIFLLQSYVCSYIKVIESYISLYLTITPSIGLKNKQMNISGLNYNAFRLAYIYLLRCERKILYSTRVRSTNCSNRSSCCYTRGTGWQQQSFSPLNYSYSMRLTPMLTSPSWPNGYGIGLLSRGLWVRVPSRVIFLT